MCVKQTSNKNVVRAHEYVFTCNALFCSVLVHPPTLTNLYIKMVEFHVAHVEPMSKVNFPQYKFNYIISKRSCKRCIKHVHLRKIPFASVFSIFSFKNGWFSPHVHIFAWISAFPSAHTSLQPTRICDALLLSWIHTFSSCVCIFFRRQLVNIYAKFAKLSRISSWGFRFFASMQRARTL